VLAAMASPATLAAFGIPAGVPGGVDGYLFPDTYQFPKDTAPDVILKKLRARLDEVIDDRMKTQMQKMGWDLHKTLTLAAIVEKETRQPDERPHISGLFHSRLKKKMRLQTDPTVIYGIEGYDGNVRRDDLTRPHPYNTYTIPGLPPGPIAQPGKAAIEAALFPLDTQDLYFVAKGDSGYHIFCPTLECHNAAVQKWQVEFYQNRR
jgi:UPF0755 protein